MNGHEATKTIRAGGATVPILALTADFSVNEGLWVTAGMNGYMEKPIKPEVLTKAMDELILGR